jgi:hypothetical protein
MNTALLLTDPTDIGQFTARLLFPAWQRRTIVTALAEAGFAVEVYRTAFSAGGQIGTVTELQRFRRDGNGRTETTQKSRFRAVAGALALS